MKVLVTKKSLADALARVERIVPSRSSNPGLSLLRIDILDDTLVLSGSNMDVDIRAQLSADVQGNGSYAVTAHVFGQVVRALPGDDVEMELSDTEMQIASGSYTTKLQLVSPASAPVLTFAESHTGSIEASQLTRALSAVRYAAAVADFQAVFRGVKIEFGVGHTRAVATDGFRLAYYHLDVATDLNADVIVPARSVEELLRVLDEGQVNLHLEGGQLSVKHGSYALNLKLMDGTFPDYQRVVPQNYPVSVALSAGRLAEAVSRVALMADKSTNNRIDLFVKDNQVQITAEGSFGRSQEALDVVQEGAESEIRLAYNSKYLIDALAPSTGEIKLKFSGPNAAPSVVEDLTDAGYLAMVVPLRTS